MTLNKKSQCRWQNTVFSVCTKLLLPASGNPSFLNSSRSVLRFVRENQICCVFALGFQVNSVVAQPFCCGSQWWCRLNICWGQRQPSFGHCLLPTRRAGTVGAQAWVCFVCLKISPSLLWCFPCQVESIVLGHSCWHRFWSLVLSHAHRDFYEGVLFKFYLLVYCSALVPYSGPSSDGLGCVTSC